ncbi:hypothetical protein DL93DRAFT_2085399 [Clavulina sp. PMI_390]|nr:hypothetical protein DL93DRAFT_2085399 [Clavulina sp. PMI_390]
MSMGAEDLICDIVVKSGPACSLGLLLVLGLSLSTPLARAPTHARMHIYIRAVYDALSSCFSLRNLSCRHQLSSGDCFDLLPSSALAFGHRSSVQRCLLWNLGISSFTLRLGFLEW